MTRESWPRNLRISSTSTPIASATSLSVGLRWSLVSSAATVRSNSRAFIRTERGIQSVERSSSMIAPRMRAIA